MAKFSTSFRAKGAFKPLPRVCAAPVFLRVDVCEVDWAVAVNDVHVRLRRQLRKQVNNVADSTAVDHHHAPDVLIAL